MSRLFGGVMMITGTCIGAGMLGLPVATATNDLLSSSILMITCWLLMTCGALFILEVNLALKPGAHLISMARTTLGRAGAIVTWICILLLLYALLAAYITGGAQITAYWLSTLHLPNRMSIAAVLFTIIFGSIVLRGIHWVDWSNRGLMSVKFLTLLLLIITIIPHTQWQFAASGSPHRLLSATTVIITSFGCGTTIPSLRMYFQENTSALKKSIVIGSLIPLLIYLAWNISVHSVLPSTGSNSLLAMQQSGNASSQLADALVAMTHSTMISVIAHLFTSICVLTSFLVVSLSLSDYLVDGTNIKKDHFKGLSINALLTFLLPLVIAILYPRAFIIALQYAGICCIILLAVLPVLMAWRLRTKELATPYHFGGKAYLAMGFVFSITALILSIIYF